MTINYDSKNDLLYMRFDNAVHTVINKRVSEEVVLDISEDGKIIGIEIMDASQHISLETILPVNISERKASWFIQWNKIDEDISVAALLKEPEAVYRRRNKK